MLLRAGESRETALKTAMKCYPDRGGLYAEPPLPKPLRSVPDGMAAFKAEDLPSNAVPYESLPSWAREIALYATDLTGKSLADLTSIAGLDLRFLNLYCADLSDLDMQNCDCMNADMRGAHIRNANIDRARMDPSIGSRVNGKLIRSYAPPSHVDTRRGNAPLRDGKVDFFHDREILDIFPVQRTERVGGVDIGYLEDGRWVIQQQAQRACSAGVSAMLSADHGGKINVHRLWSRSLADEAQVLIDLKGATDYTPITARPQTVEALAEQLNKHGSAIVSVNGEIGSHFIIVDGIDLTAHTVALRDPYHGWAIQVPLVAFTSRWAPGSQDRIVQLSLPHAQASPPPALWA
ncbi:pentapeptide repeat-containing protein [Bordetella sp. H567]|uniref:pentapeptide repeat-containing protein n=1 Tax=Bordetella sp. H567 TaxID=1697043 RepID=UPI00131437DC|nr:pentapeptide repeat-containing protein [Bordetella sp. H567]